MGWSLLPTMYCMAVCIQNQKTSLCIPNKKCVVDSNNGTYISIGIGSKKFPIHFLVIHGSVKIRNPPAIKMDLMKEWFKSEGQVEGIVWHCANGTLFKVTIYLTFQLKLKLFYLIKCLFLWQIHIQCHYTYNIKHMHCNWYSSKTFFFANLLLDWLLNQGTSHWVTFVLVHILSLCVIQAYISASIWVTWTKCR